MLSLFRGKTFKKKLDDSKAPSFVAKVPSFVAKVAGIFAKAPRVSKKEVEWLNYYYWCTTPYEDKDYTTLKYKENWVATFYMKLANNIVLDEAKFAAWPKVPEYDEMAYLCPFIAFKYEE